MGWLEDSICTYNEHERYDEEKKHRLSIKSMNSIPASFDGIRHIMIDYELKDDLMCVLSQIFTRATELEFLSIPGTHLLTWESICSLPLQKIKKLTFSMTGSASGTTMIAPEMTRLCIFGSMELTPLEIMMNPAPHIDFSGMPNLERLELRHFQQVCPEDFQALSRLKHLVISGAPIEDLTWFRTASYRLNTLMIDGDLGSCTGLEAQTDLHTLRLYNSNISDVSVMESLRNLKYLDLRFNNLREEGNLRQLGLDELIITHRDHALHSMRTRLSDIVNWAVIRLRMQNRKKPEDMPEGRRKFFLHSLERPFEERIKPLIQSEFDSILDRLQKERKILGIRMDKEEYIALFTEMAQEYFPFLKV